MEYRSITKYLRVSPRKVRLVADSVKKLTPIAALTQLSAMPKNAADDLAKAIQSALANAKQKGIDEGALIFKTIEVGEGPVMKRWRAIRSGSAHGYKKRMSHIRVVLTDEGKQEKEASKKE